MEEKTLPRNRTVKTVTGKGQPATKKQISVALDEKCPVPDNQKSKKRKLDSDKRQDRKQEKVAEITLDQELASGSGAKRSLFADEDDEDFVVASPSKSAKLNDTDSSCKCSLLKKHGKV